MKIHKKFILIFAILMITFSICTSGIRNVIAEHLSYIPIPLESVDFPERPKPLLELGETLLGRGPIGKGIALPTGAVWNPALIIWGTYRTAMQFAHDGEDSFLEWANRFDLWGNFNLTATERIFAEVRFLDREGDFTGALIHHPTKEDEGFNDELNFNFTSLFFEGSFDEIFPFLDPYDKYGLDFTFAIGRQRLSAQGGMLLQDSVDGFGISKVNLKTLSTVNHRMTFVMGVNELNRNNLPTDDRKANLYGIFQEVDWRKSTVAFDLIYVDSPKSTGSSFHGGLSAVSRIGSINTTFRILGSIPASDETDHNSGGVLLFTELGHTLGESENYIYTNFFLGIEEFRSASRSPNAGGPLSGPGILFESVGLGSFPTALDNQADEAFGGALGYQMFFDGTRKQLILEVGGRHSSLENGQSAFGTGLRYQMALGRRHILRWDNYVVYGDNQRLNAARGMDTDIGIGSRMEWVIKF